MAEATGGFEIYDRRTGKRADPEVIARTEEWASGLMSMDMEGFAIDQDGEILLVDECGKFAHTPADRFEVVWRNAITPWSERLADELAGLSAILNVVLGSGGRRAKTLSMGYQTYHKARALLDEYRAERSREKAVKNG